MRFRQLHAGLVSSGHRYAISPYLVGYKIWRDIERRWQEPGAETTWYGERIRREGGDGLSKLFEVAADYRDTDFVRSFLTEQLVEELDLYAYAFQGVPAKRNGRWVVEESPWEQVRDGLVEELADLGIPAIVVMDGDYQNRGELYLVHDFESNRRPLDIDYARRTLALIQSLWGRPVHIETNLDGKTTVLSFVGGSMSRQPV